MKMRIFASTCALCAAFGLLAPPASAQGASLPSVDQILEKYVASLGGRAAFAKLHSRLSIGTLEQEGGVSLAVELWSKEPNKFRFELSIPNTGSIIQAYDGSVAWDSNPQDGARELSGSARLNRMRNAQFHRETNMKQLYKSFRVTGTAQIGELTAFVVEASPAQGPPDILYFGADSGLLLRRDSNYEDEGRNITFETYYEDYREVDGVKLPFALRRAGADNSNFTIRFATIQHNVPMDDSKFSKPAAPANP